MRSYALPVLVRTAVLTAVSWAMWLLADVLETSDGGFIWLLVVPATLAGVAFVWAAVDGIRNGRRGDPVRIGLLVWLLVAGATGLLQPVLLVVKERRSGSFGGDPWDVGQLETALYYAVILAVPAVLAFGLGWLAGRRVAQRTRP